jgi:Protein of unknown function (DUF2786)
MKGNLSPDRKKYVERIAKLLALSEGTTFGAEAEAAREAALRLMAEHNIRAAETKDEPFESRRFKPYFQNDVWHERQLKFAIGKLNNCLTLVSWLDPEAKTVHSWCFVGRPSDLDAYEYMVAIVLRQRTEAWNKYKAQGGPDGKGKWLFGYARGVEDKVDELLDDVAARMRAQRGNALAPVALLEQALAWWIEKNGPLGDHPYHNQGGGAEDGYSAGSKVNLYRGELGRTGRIGSTRRITGPKEI